MDYIDKLFILHYDAPMSQEVLQPSTKWLIPEKGEIEITPENRQDFHITKYVGCYHGGDEFTQNWLRELVNGPDYELPDTIVFSGDLPGAMNGRTITQKALFYNSVMNVAGPLLSTTPDISPENLLNTHIEQLNPESPTIRDGVVKLLEFAVNEMGMMEKSGPELDSLVRQLAMWQIKYHPYDNMPEISDDMTSDQLFYNYIKWIKNTPSEGKFGLNSGTWVGTLPIMIREKYLAQYQKSMEFLGDQIVYLQDNRGVNIIWVEGNEDMQVSLNAIAHDLDPDVVFNPQAYLENCGIKCVKELTGIRNGTEYLILAPFNVLKNPSSTTPEQIELILQEVGQARKDGLTVNLIAHGQLDWGRHFPGQTAKGEAAIIIANLQRLLEFFHPEQLTHAHQHNIMPGSPDINAKFIYEPTGTVVTYLPLNTLGEQITKIPKQEDPILVQKAQYINRIV